MQGLVRFICAGASIATSFWLLLSLNALAEDARVLPGGRSRLSMVYGQTAPISSTFSYDGGNRSIAAPYNLDLSSANLKKFSPEMGALIDGLNTNGAHFHYNVNARSNGYNGVTTDPGDPLLGDAISRGFLNVNAEGFRQQYNMVFQYGVSERLSIGFGLPIIKNQVRVSSSFSGVNTAGDIYQALHGINGDIDAALNQLRGINEETLQKLLADKGYDRFADTTASGMGDAIIGARLKYHDATHPSGDWIASFQAGVTVPTGVVKRPAQITTLDFGQGAWDVGIAHIVNYSPIRLLTFSQGIHYTLPIWSHKLMRVQRDANDIIPDASTEEDVAFRLGDKASTTLGAHLALSKAVGFDMNMEWAWKGPSSFHGDRPDPDYAYLSSATSGNFNSDAPSFLQTLTVAVSMSTIPAFLKSDFPLPADINLSVNLPLTGRNTIIAPYGTAELALYF